MSTLGSATLTRAAPFPTWAQVDEGLHVGSRAGEFIGYIDVTGDGHHVAFDGRSTPVGRYATLREAQRAVTGVARRARPRRSAALVEAAQTLATASGLVATALLVTAGTLAPPM